MTENLSFCIGLIAIFSCFQVILADQNTKKICAVVEEKCITYEEVEKQIEKTLRDIENSELSVAEKEEAKKSVVHAQLLRMVDNRLLLLDARAYNLDTGKLPAEIFRELFYKYSEYSVTENRRARIDITVPPEKIREYYRQHGDKFISREKIKIRIIDLDYKEFGGKEKALEKGHVLVSELRDGADFAEMAELYSDGPCAEDGGAWPKSEKNGEVTWDFVERGTLRLEVENVVFSLKPGEISDPIPVDLVKFCEIVKIEDRQPERIVPFSEAQIEIYQELRYQNAIKGLNQLRDLLRRKYFVWPQDLFSSDNYDSDFADGRDVLLGELRICGNFRIPSDVIYNLLPPAGQKNLAFYSIERAVFRIEKDYRESGFPFVSVKTNRQPDHGKLNVSFSISEGPRVSIAKIRFSGNHSFKDDALSDLFEIGERDEKSPLYYKNELLGEGLILLSNFYRNEGFLDVSAKYEEPVYSQDRSEVTLHIMIDEGPRYRIRNIECQINPMSSEKLTGQLLSKKNDYVNQLEIIAEKKNIEKTYEEKNGQNIHIQEQVIYDLQEPVIDVYYKIAE